MVIKYVVIILALKNLRFIGKYQKLIVQPFLNYPNLIKSSYNSKTSSGPNRPAAVIGGGIFGDLISAILLLVRSHARSARRPAVLKLD